VLVVNNCIGRELSLDESLLSLLVVIWKCCWSDQRSLL